MTKVPLAQNIARSLARYRNPGIGGSIALYGRALWLGWQLPAPPRVVSRPERLVVTLTTIPARASRLRRTLRSLIDQSEPADRIVLCLPWTARGNGEPYPHPATLDLPPGVEVLRCTDEGPATKLLPMLREEPDACLVVVDDDVVYPRDFLASLLAAHRADPSAAQGLRGVRVSPGVAFPALHHELCSAQDAPRAVDILFGTWGYLVPPGALDDQVHDFADYPEAVRWVDDVWISGHLARRGVQRIVVPTRSFPVETRASAIQALTDGPNRSGQNDAIAIAAFAEAWGGSTGW
jgi:hypothetical protein